MFRREVSRNRVMGNGVLVTGNGVVVLFHTKDCCASQLF